MFGPFTISSPIPSLSVSTTLALTLGTAFPMLPNLYSLFVPIPITGDVSVKPYPCTRFIPNNLYFSSIFLSKAAAPLINS